MPACYVIMIAPHLARHAAMGAPAVQAKHWMPCAAVLLCCCVAVWLWLCGCVAATYWWLLGGLGTKLVRATYVQAEAAP